MLSLVAAARGRRGARARSRACARQLLEARAARPQPALDDKALASWNGMALAALAEGARLCRRPDLLAAAERCAAFLLGPLSHPDGGLWRTHRAGPQPGARLPGRLRAGRRRTARALPRDARAPLPGRVAAPRAARDASASARPTARSTTPRTMPRQLVARPREFDDNPTPSGNSTLAGLLVRLARTYGEPELERRARAVVAAGRDAAGARAPGLRAPARRLRRAALAAARGGRRRRAGRSRDGRADALRCSIPTSRTSPSRSATAATTAGVPLLAGRGLVGGRRGRVRVQRVRLRGARDGRSHGAHSLA